MSPKVSKSPIESNPLRFLHIFLATCRQAGVSQHFVLTLCDTLLLSFAATTSQCWSSCYCQLQLTSLDNRPLSILHSVPLTDRDWLKSEENRERMKRRSHCCEFDTNCGIKLGISHAAVDSKVTILKKKEHLQLCSVKSSKLWAV